MDYGDDGGSSTRYDTAKPRILLMGLQSSGKSSIQQVVFHKMSPNETLFLESSNSIQKDDISNSSFVQFQIWDFPGQIDFLDSAYDTQAFFGGCGALVFVIDGQLFNAGEHDQWDDAAQLSLTRLMQTIEKGYSINPDISFEVFIHKVDGLADDTKIDVTREIHAYVQSGLASKPQLADVHISFYLTSIYDHSIFEAFSKVVQKLIPQLSTLENLLNLFNSKCKVEKSFLFDIVSKIYIATDSTPVDMKSYELCSDIIDVAIDVSCIYGTGEDGSLSAYDAKSSSVIKLNNGIVLYLRQVNTYLALVCLIQEENYDEKSLIDFNFQCFREALGQLTLF
eukprot:TRINITY_DN10881_c0_g1_i1.p1 TRINITY_DN10881_c0_g1~~TRINITY_DN10881_c0_g1_i1.p1  ORF type:complete len:359 (+),score=78.29 TRINITY_DN10881_c0_g1_i1:64-1077(+)